MFESPLSALRLGMAQQSQPEMGSAAETDGGEFNTALRRGGAAGARSAAKYRRDEARSKGEEPAPIARQHGKEAAGSVYSGKMPKPHGSGFVRETAARSRGETLQEWRQPAQELMIGSAVEALDSFPLPAGAEPLPASFLDPPMPTSYNTDVGLGDALRESIRLDDDNGEAVVGVNASSARPDSISRLELSRTSEQQRLGTATLPASLTRGFDPSVDSPSKPQPYIPPEMKRKMSKFGLRAQCVSLEPDPWDGREVEAMLGAGFASKEEERKFKCALRPLPAIHRARAGLPA